MTFNVESSNQVPIPDKNPLDTKNNKPVMDFRKNFKRPQALTIQKLNQAITPSENMSSKRHSIGDHRLSLKFTEGHKDLSKCSDNSPGRFEEFGGDVNFTPQQRRITDLAFNTHLIQPLPEIKNLAASERENIFQNPLVSNHLCESFNSNLYLPMNNLLLVNC